MRLKSCLKLSKSAANGKAASVGGLFLGWAGDGTSMLFRVHFSPAGLPLERDEVRLIRFGIPKSGWL